MVASSWSHWQNLRNLRALWRWWWFQSLKGASQIHSLAWQTYLERQQSSQTCGTLSVWEHWPGSRGPGKCGVVTLGPSCKHTHRCAHMHTQTQTHRQTDTHTATHTHTNLRRQVHSCIDQSVTLIIVVVLEQYPQFVCIRHKQKSILSTYVYINSSLFCIQDPSWIFTL